jgi:GTPase involved in cell partitioning and DNA repair
MMSAKVDDSKGSYTQQIETWRSQRVERLKAPGCWMSLIGLHWLKDGKNTVGSAKDNDIVLNAGPAHLGVVTLSDDRGFVVADVPGLIKGAHEGTGLGHQFLRHVERTKVLIHLVDVSGASGRDPVEDVDTIVEELRLFDPAVAAKPQIVAANKIDALDDEARLTALEKHVKKLGLPLHRISGVSGEGIEALLEAAWRHIAAVRTVVA